MKGHVQGDTNALVISYQVKDSAPTERDQNIEENKTGNEEIPLDKLKSMQMEAVKTLNKLKEEIGLIEKNSILQQKIKKIHVYNELKVEPLTMVSSSFIGQCTTSYG